MPAARTRHFSVIRFSSDGQGDCRMCVRPTGHWCVVAFPDLHGLMRKVRCNNGLGAVSSLAFPVAERLTFAPDKHEALRFAIGTCGKLGKNTKLSGVGIFDEFGR